MIEAIKGTKDIKGQDIDKFDYIVDKAKGIVERFGYNHIITPTFEETALFKRGIGEGTDIVEKEMYTFIDKGDRSITLRPEGTASVVRSYLEHKVYGKEGFTKYFYYGPMFRYEKPQKGRYREFYQFGIEALGIDSPSVDAEMISIGYMLLKELNILDIEVQINSVGCPECRKVYREKLIEFLTPKLGTLCEDCKVRYNKNPLRVLDCKIENCKVQTKDAPVLTEYLCEPCKNHFEIVKRDLNIFEVPFIINKRLVRGLDYYTNTAFEIVSNNLGAQGTVLAGGRYNNLAEEIGGKRIPAVGFAAGIERISMLVPDADVREKRPLVFAAYMGEDARKYTMKLVQNMRKNGIYAEVDYEGRSIKSQMNMADKHKAKYTMIIGDTELNENKVILKNMETREQISFELNNIINRLKEDLE